MRREDSHHQIFSILQAGDILFSTDRHQIGPHHDAVGFDQAREMAEIVGDEGAHLKSAFLVYRYCLAEIDRVLIQLLDRQFTLQPHEVPHD